MKNTQFITNNTKNKLFQNEFIEIISENANDNNNNANLISDKIISFIME